MRSQNVVSDIDRTIGAAILGEISVFDGFSPVCLFLGCCSFKSYCGEQSDVFVLVVVGASCPSYALDRGGVWTAAHGDGLYSRLDSHEITE